MTASTTANPAPDRAVIENAITAATSLIASAAVHDTVRLEWYGGRPALSTTSGPLFAHLSEMQGFALHESHPDFPHQRPWSATFRGIPAGGSLTLDDAVRAAANAPLETPAILADMSAQDALDTVASAG